MGQRMPDEPIEYGDDCDNWPDPTKTPKFVYARFAGMIACPNGHPAPPNDRVFKLEQVDGVPCRWLYVTNDWLVQFELPDPQPQVNFWLTIPFGGPTYFGELPAMIPDEGYVYHNEIVVCDIGYGAKGGIATVTWTPQATALLAAMNITKSDDLFMELFPVADGGLVYKFCKISESTNIKFLYSP